MSSPSTTTGPAGPNHPEFAAGDLEVDVRISARRIRPVPHRRRKRGWVRTDEPGPFLTTVSSPGPRHGVVRPRASYVRTSSGKSPIATATSCCFGTRGEPSRQMGHRCPMTRWTRWRAFWSPLTTTPPAAATTLSLGLPTRSSIARYLVDERLDPASPSCRRHRSDPRSNTSPCETPAKVRGPPDGATSHQPPGSTYLRSLRARQRRAILPVRASPTPTAARDRNRRSVRLAVRSAAWYIDRCGDARGGGGRWQRWS